MVMMMENNDLLQKFTNLDKLEKVDLEYEAAIYNRKNKDAQKTAYLLFIEKYNQGKYDF
jgi:hypothetical protein